VFSSPATPFSTLMGLGILERHDPASETDDERRRDDDDEV
jgi:hypothetical protein